MNKVPTPVLLWPLVALLVVLGILHFVVPTAIMRIMPDSMPWQLPLVYLSGVAELLIALALVVPRWRTVGAWLLAAMLVVYLPLHVLDYLRDQPAIGPKFVALLRIPLQLVFIGSAIVLALRFRRI